MYKDDCHYHRDNELCEYAECNRLKDGSWRGEG